MRHTTIKFQRVVDPTTLWLTDDKGDIREYKRLDRGNLAPNVTYTLLVRDEDSICQIVGIHQKAIDSLATNEAARKVVADLQKIKIAVGPVIGRIKKHWPESSKWYQQAIDIYERAKALQDEIGRLR